MFVECALFSHLGLKGTRKICPKAAKGSPRRLFMVKLELDSRKITGFIVSWD